MFKTKITAEPGKQEIIFSREFDAPRELVYRLWTDPRYVPEWWGPADLTTTVDSMDVRKGGIWRFVQRDAQGNEFAFNGVFHEASFPERIVQTTEFEGMPGVGLETITFEETEEGKTRLTGRSLFPSVEARDGALRSGMEQGARELYERFAALLERQQSSDH